MVPSEGPVEANMGVRARICARQKATEGDETQAQTDRRTDRQTDRPTDRQTDRQAGRRLDSAPVSDVVALATKVGPAGRLRW